MIIDNELHLDFSDVLISPVRSTLDSRKSVDLIRPFKMPNAKNPDGTPVEWKGVPLIAANMDTTGSFKMTKALAEYQCMTALHKHYKPKDIIQFLKENINISHLVFVSSGIRKDDLENLEVIERLITDDSKHNICLDVANGSTEYFVSVARKLREKFPHRIIMAGNVATPEMVQELVIHGGVDIVKVGIGPGSACITRLKTGVGIPQFSCVAKCSNVAHGLNTNNTENDKDSWNGLICSDGGCVHPGDVSKAFGAGADFVMLGGMFAGTDECEGTWYYETKTKEKKFVFYGMASKEAQEKHGNGVEDYKTSEGKKVIIDAKGPVEDVIKDILGGVRSTCTYVGAKNLKSLNRCCRFVRVNNQVNNCFR